MTQPARKPGEDDNLKPRMEITHTPRSTMLTWPHTVSEERMHQAQDTLLSMADAIDRGTPFPPWTTPEQANDMTQLMLSQETECFQRQAASTFTKITVNLEQGQDPIRQMFYVAQQGTTAETVGLMLELQADTQPTTGERMKARSFTRLNRHPDWTGYNASLERMRGTDVMVYEAPGAPGDPHIIAAVHSDIHTPYPEHTTFPAGLPSILRDLALWHGARSCTWIPQSRTSQKSRII